MGHNWSLYFCQRAMELRASGAQTLEGCVRMEDRGPSILLRDRGRGRHCLEMHAQSDGAHFFIYVDHLGVLSHDAADARRRLDGVISVLESVGLVVHETMTLSDRIETVGVELVCQHLITPSDEEAAVEIEGSSACSCSSAEHDGRDA